MTEMHDFKLDAFLQAAAELARADEVERALKLLDNLPAYYRDHEPKEVTDLRSDLMKHIATVNFYKDTDFHPGQLDLKDIDGTLRSRLLVLEVDQLNKKGFTPHIVDFGPGEYWVPIILNNLNLQYTYQPISINDLSYNKCKHLFEDKIRMKSADQPSVFLALEVIEHLWHEDEIKINMLREAGMCDIVHLSTPKYTHRPDVLDWREIGTLGHLRAYTPMEFFTKAQEMFKEYGNFTYFDSDILHARGQWHGSRLEKYNLELKD